MPIDIVQIDAFTSEPYRGNPAAVCLMDGPADEAWMRRVAREMNLSETAFLYPIDGGYHLRWLTPRTEVDLCGHATLATAHMLFEDDREPSDKPIRFFTRSGWVSASKDGDWIELDFPVNAPDQIDPPAELLDALGAGAEYVGVYPKAFLVVVSNDNVVRQLAPNLEALERLPRPKVCVTAADSTGRADFVSRLFAPALGIPEDPVNGNSHTALAPFWSSRLGKQAMISHYVSARGGEIRVRLKGDRVGIAGRAITVMRAKLTF